MPTGPPGLLPPGGGGGTTKPPGSTVYTPPTLPFARPGLKVFVRRSDGTPLPNIRLLNVQQREFLPPVAHFRYAFDLSSNASVYDPYRVEHCFPLTATGPRVVKIDDRIQVVRQVGTRRIDILFDGFIVAPEATLGGSTETVHFTAIGTPIREEDTPIGGMVMRDTDGLAETPVPDPPPPGFSAPKPGKPQVDPALPQDIQTDLPARFNPDGKPNATPIGGDSKLFPGATNEIAYQVFGDVEDTEEDFLRLWTLAMAVRYCLVVGNPSTKYVKYDSVDKLDDLFKTVRPAKGYEFIDWMDENTYTKEEIVVPDIDITGSSWPSAVRRLIEPYGFGFRFDLTTDETGEPSWKIEFYRKDDPSHQKSSYLQKPPRIAGPGVTLIPGKSTITELSMVRDCAGIQNYWKIASEPIRYEASLILAPGFLVNPDDILTPEKYVKGVDESSAGFDPDLFRLFIVDETGEGHWDYKSGTFKTDIPSLRKIFQPDDDDSDPRTYVHRRRKPRQQLISRDPHGNLKHAELWLSTNYQPWTTSKAIDQIGVWEPDLPCPFGSTGGDWQRVTKGGWKVCEHRLGIELTMSDPRVWAISNPSNFSVSDTTVPFPTGIVNIPQCVIGPVPTAKNQRPSTTPRFAFRLTCVFEGDHDMDVEAKRRPASPTKFDIVRYDDTRDRFQKHIVTLHSHVADANAATEATAYPDDTTEAQAHADARRRANECGSFAGTLKVGYFTDAYKIGDKLKDLVGRDLDFSMNAGREQGEAPIYPVVVGIDTHYDAPQGVVIQFQDFRAEPVLNERRRARYE